VRIERALNVVSLDDEGEDEHSGEGSTDAA
jgi:hypothetical protein